MKKEYMQVIDCNTNEIICSGEILNKKVCIRYRDNSNEKQICEDVFMPSMDNKHFFNSKSDRFKLHIDENEIDSTLSIPNDYIIEKWRHYKYNRNADIYHDNDIFSVDEEIKDLVRIINEIDGMETVGSCSGHYEHSLFVDIKFFDFKKLILFTTIISNKMSDKFELKTSQSIKQLENNCVILRLKSLNIGKQAYEDAQMLINLCDMIKGC